MHRSHTHSSPPPMLPQQPAPTPPRPPKKAEFVGNPLDPTPPLADSTQTNLNTSAELVDGSNQGTQHHMVEDEDSTLPWSDAGSLIPTSTPLTVAMPTITPVNAATQDTSTSLSMEEQMRELQKQHQMQMESLGIGQFLETSSKEDKQEVVLSPDHTSTAIAAPPPIDTTLNDLLAFQLPISSQESFRDAPPLSVGPSLDVSSTESGGGVLPQTSPGGNLIPHDGSQFVAPSSEDEEGLKEKKVLLDLQRLLQPPHEVSTLPSQLDTNTSLQELDSGMSNANTIPASNITMDHNSDSSITSASQDASKYLPIQSWSQNVSSAGPVVSTENISEFSSQDSSVPNLLTQLPASSLLRDQDEGEGSFLANHDLRIVENQTTSKVLSPSHTLNLSGRVSGEGGLGLIPTTEGVGHLENTTTIDSTSRPIPAPGLSPTDPGLGLGLGPDASVSIYSKLTSPTGNQQSVAATIPPTSALGLDTTLPYLSDIPYRPIPGIGSMTLHTPQSFSSISLDVGASPLTRSSNPDESLQALLASNTTLQLAVDEKTREVEQNRATVADQKSQLDNYKQQLLILQQQLGQVSLQQQKQEQEKATASGQQAVLMQLLQQQQGMFSQQQAQIEKLSKATDSNRREQMEAEMKYKQALVVEQEKNAGLTAQNFQQNQEMLRLQQQLQSSSQQQQMVQMHLYQYQTQIQERDKQLLAFRDQHKQIIQNLEQRYQQRVAQMLQQIQELQGELKKLKSQKRTRGPTSAQQQAGGVYKAASQMPAQQFQNTSSATQMHNQQFVQSPKTPSYSGVPMTPSSATPGGLPERHSEILSPTSVARNQSVQHPMQPLKLINPQSPQVPSAGMSTNAAPLVATQTGPPPQLPPPLTPQLTSGVATSQHNPSVVGNPGNQQQVPQDGMNRSMSWSSNQQQPLVPQGNQQQFHHPGHPQQLSMQQQQQLQPQQQQPQQQQQLQQQQPQQQLQQQQQQPQQQLQQQQQPQQQLQQQHHQEGQGFSHVSSQQFVMQPQLPVDLSTPPTGQGMAVLTPQQVQGKSRPNQLFSLSNSPDTLSTY